jgi:predicted ATP-binding protein involved in virulence
MRTDGYQDCLSPASQFEHFRMWFTAEFRAFREEQAIAIEQGRPLPEFPPSVRAVRAVVDAILKEQTGWHSLEYRASERALVLSHPVQGLIPVSRLSDGIRGVVALVADIAARCVQLNPAFGAEAPQKTGGVVLIDEIDLHLHPRWQQVILPLLRSAFPKLQFVVTTHSPQVLSSVHASEIRVLSQGASVPRGGGPAAWTALPPGDESYGQSNQDVLERVMGTHSRPPVEGAADLARLTELVDQGAGEKDEAKRLFETLQTDFSDDLRALRRTLERRRLLAERAGRGTKV